MWERFSFENDLRCVWSLAQEGVGGLGLEFKAGGIPFSLNDACLGRGADEAVAFGGVVIDESAFEAGGIGIDCGGEGVPTGRDQHHLLSFLVGDLVAFRGGRGADGCVWSKGDFFLEDQDAFSLGIVDFQSQKGGIRLGSKDEQLVARGLRSGIGQCPDLAILGGRKDATRGIYEAGTIDHFGVDEHLVGRNW